MFILSIFGFLTLSLITLTNCCNKSKNKDKNPNAKPLAKQPSRSKLMPAAATPKSNKIKPVEVKEIVVNNNEPDLKIGGEKNKLEPKKSNINGKGTEDEGAKTQKNGDATMDENVVWLKVDHLPKLDKTISDEIFSPAVHERANKIAADKLIIDPKFTTYGGNIDQLPEKERQAKLSKFQEELENNKNLTDSKELSNKTSNNLRVKVREDKCMMFETNEVPTDDEEEEHKQDEYL